ncbi:MAG: caspase family protein [Deltaproteobacteria bacterium]|nr:caspase family protein [Deltaproteobacteria bacterium]MBI3295024.1 caspase family protein [Deltaproteobacteria bacterium]
MNLHHMIVVGASLAVVALFASEQPPQIKRFAFVIGQNSGGRQKPRLRYAASDANSVWKLMKDLGGVGESENILVINPSRLELLDRMNEMKTLIERKRLPNTRTELFFYYSGHSDDEGLLLNDDRIAYPELKNRIKDMAADLSIIVLDSCASGTLTRIKGGHKAAPFLTDALSKLKGYVALTSSSGDEVAQESDRIKGSYFTHYLVSGLRGAADLSQDNRVTLNEAYQYAYNQTLARTEKTASGAQHPSYSIQLTGSGELVMTDLRRVSAKVVLDKNVMGRVFIRDKADTIVAEIDKITQKPMAIGLEAGAYSLILFKDQKIGKANITLAANRFAEISATDFAPVEAEVTAVRGGASVLELSEDSEVINIPAEFSILPGVSTNVISPDITANNFSFSLLYARPVRLSGVAFSVLGGTRVRGPMKGAQVSPFFNEAQSVTGAQIGGWNRSLGEVTGFQLGVTNISPKKVTGAQMGGVNRADEEVVGAQLGVSNLSFKKVTGFQFGIVNRTEDEIIGAQIGGINSTPKLDQGFQFGGFNRSDSPLVGAQLGGINVLPHPIIGGQIGALFNQSTEITGIQAGGINTVNQILGAQLAGLFNDAETVRGVQVAFLNHATNIDGVQIGVANDAGDISGVQVGLVNRGATEEGVTVGLVNLPKRGQFRVSYSLDDQSYNSFALKYGTRNTYSFIQYGSKAAEGRTHHNKSLGLGGDIPLGRFSLNLEALFSHLDKDTLANTGGITLFQARLLPRYRITDWLAVFAGATFNAKLTGSTYDFDYDEPKARPWFGYLGGVEYLI